MKSDIRILQEFIDYVLSFYAKDEMYDIKATRDEVLIATGIRLERFNDNEFCGDSFDREKVRDIILELRG